MYIHVHYVLRKKPTNHACVVRKLFAVFFSVYNKETETETKAVTEKSTATGTQRVRERGVEESESE